MIVIVMGVSGSGKSTIGKLLAQSLEANFVEGDDYHPRKNIEKMLRGAPINDRDRQPWLESLASAMDEWRREKRNVVLACSALKHRYRQILAGSDKDTYFVHLKGDETLIRERFKNRTGHFMPASLLSDQFATLEEPPDAITVEIANIPEVIISIIQEKLDAKNG
ncbi:MAG: gluconokinase [Proteobacteria bacterium]|nr:gluconokinase [Pseudomonadota bacterium]